MSPALPAGVCSKPTSRSQPTWLVCFVSLLASAVGCGETSTGGSAGSAGMSVAGTAGVAGQSAAGSSGSANAPGGASGTSGSGGAAGGSAGGAAGAGSGSSGAGFGGGSGGTLSGGAAGGGAGGSAGAAGSAGRAGDSASGGAAGQGDGGSAGSSGSSGSAGSAGSAESGGAAGTSGDDYHPCPTDGAACKILPFGDSITDGFGTGGAYRVELFRLAHQAGKNITFVGTGSNGPSMVDGVQFPPQHEGHSGFTIDPTQSRSGISPLVGSVMPQFTPHIITLMIGTNDCIDDHELANAPVRLGALLDSIYEELPEVLIVVGQPIPSQEDALNARIRGYNASIPAVVQARADAGRHIRLVDMYAPFVAVTDYKTSLLKDTWHPNEAGHAILGERWYSVLAELL